MICYEHPLNERVRTLLRLEKLYNKVGYFCVGEEGDALKHHVALITLFEILDVAGRADLKSEMLQELERQKQTLEALRDNPDVSADVLVRVLEEINGAFRNMLAMTGKIGQHLRENEWLMSIKQRVGLPGGVCEFDLPSYHYWLHQSAAARGQDLSAWLAPLLPIRDGLAIVLRLLRDSGRTTHHNASQGAFQQMLAGRAAQLVRLNLPEDLPCTPEISANKYALNIRFVQVSTAQKPKTFEGNVEFDLTFCSL